MEGILLVDWDMQMFGVGMGMIGEDILAAEEEKVAMIVDTYFLLVVGIQFGPVVFLHRVYSILGLVAEIRLDFGS